MTKNHPSICSLGFSCSVLAVVLTVALLSSGVRGAIEAGAAQRDITLPVGLEIQHYYRTSVGVHDPLFARCLYLRDDEGHEVAIICLDLIFADFATCDELRSAIEESTGIKHSIINFTHNHSSAALGRRGRTQVSNDQDSRWNDGTLDAILDVAKSAKQSAKPASLRSGRAPCEIGYNRRLVHDDGRVFMGVNRDGPSVPWVNVLIVEDKAKGKPISVLFETAAHPVIVPDSTKRISADYPGAAVRRVLESIGGSVIPIFGQGCCGNINGFPLRSSYENAVKQGEKLGDAVLQAIQDSVVIESETFAVKTVRASLPSRPLPTVDQLSRWLREQQEEPRRVRQIRKMLRLIETQQQPPSRRLDVTTVMFGNEWCLTTLPHEMFCEYERWIDTTAPFRQTMTFGYTNGYQGYIATDADLKLGSKGGYEAGALPNWGGQVYTEHFGPPAVGCEQIIREAVASLWPVGQVKPTAAVRPAKDAPQPFSPLVSKSKMKLPDGFAIDLIAAEPTVEEPSCVAFDEFGRMFVCELHGYNVEGEIDVARLNQTGELDKTVRRIRWEIQGGEIAEQAKQRQYGKLKLLEDTDGDGLMDKATIWADQLPPCYGIVAARGGIIVACAPHIMFFADRDNDGSPEIRTQLFTGFRTDVLERGINNPRWGLDNWIYFGAGGSGGTITGPNLNDPVELRHSDFRIKSDGSAIEAVSGRVGTFGMTLNSIGDRFPSTGGRPAMYALPLPYRYLARNPHVPTPSTNHQAVSYDRGFRISEPHPWRVRRRQDPEWIKFYGEHETNSNYFSGGCSNEYYAHDLFPEEYRGNLFYCEPSLNIVHRCVIERDGPGYRGRRAAGEAASEFLASTDQWFRPMNLRVAPDGSLIIVDMYREIVEDYSAIPRFLQQQYGLDKGRTHGRIWRLRPSDFSPKPAPVIAQLRDDGLLSLLAVNSPWHQATAQRLLVERSDRRVAEAARASLRRSMKRSTESLPTQRIRLLYTLQGLEVLQPNDVLAGLTDRSYGVRIHALRLADRWLDSNQDVFRAVAKLANDDDPSVRLQVAMSLGATLAPAATHVLSRMSQTYGDEQWMASAILSSSRQRAGRLVTSLVQLEPLPKQAISLIEPLAATVAGERLNSEISGLLASCVNASLPTQQACLQGLLRGLDGRPPLKAAPDGWAPVNQYLRSEHESVRQLATQLAQHLPPVDESALAELFQQAVSVAEDQNASAEARTKAIRTLASAPYETLRPIAVTILGSEAALELQLAAIDTLGTRDHPSVGEDLLRSWSILTPTLRQAVTETMLSRQSRWPTLLAAIADGRVRTNEISAIAQDRLRRHPNSKTAQLAQKLFTKQADEELKLRIETYREAIFDVSTASVTRGQQVYLKQCASCHRFEKQGHRVGPDLITVLNKPNETLLQEILDPNARIDPEYRSYIVTTSDGRSISGLIKAESATSITLVNEKGEAETILRRAIDEVVSSESSLMPSNLHETIRPADLRDLLYFLRN